MCWFYYVFSGDEFVDIHGKSVTGMILAQVVEVIKAAPEVVIATVRPITVLKKFQEKDTSRSHYSTIVPQATPTGETNGAKASIIHHDTTPPTHNDGDLDDVGNYDDEDDGDAPPPLPPRTEDALILVDPPPLGG